MTVDSEQAGDRTQRLRQGHADGRDGIEGIGKPHPEIADGGLCHPFGDTIGIPADWRPAPERTESDGDRHWVPPRPVSADPVAADPWPLDGRRILGDYELIGEIARGGVGIVYLARQQGLDRPVALKVLRDGAGASPADARRFRHEAETMAKLEHPHIVPIYEVGEDRGCSFFSMRLIEGGNLSDRDEGSGRDHRRSARLVLTVARAIHHAHERGILHRDLKPSNILLDECGQPQVADFGLARRVDLESDLTRTGIVLGTPAYMAPEQVDARKGSIAVATDVHGLGAILYFLLTGRAPYMGASVQGRVRGKPPSLIDPSVDRDLETICLRCLEDDPAARYPTAEAVAEDLGRWLDGRPPQARRAGRLERSWRACRRHPDLTAWAVGAALLAVAAAVGLIAGDRARQAAMRHEQEARRKGSALRVERHAQDVWEAGRALAGNDGARARELLRRQVPGPGEDDLRGFAWHYLSRLGAAGRPPIVGHEGDTYYATFSPDGRTIASTGKDGTLRLWDRQTGAIRNVLRGHDGEVNWVSFSPDGRTLATAGDDRTVRLWDAEAGRPVSTLTCHHDEAVAALFLPCGRLLSIDRKGRVILWNDARTAIDRSFTVAVGVVQSMAASPDGALLAISGAGVVIWDLAAGRERARLETQGERVNGLGFSPDGASLAAACWRAVRVWETRGWTLEASFGGDGGPIQESVAFSPDGRHLVWVGFDGLIHVLDRASGVAHVIPGDQGRGRLWCARFSPDGRDLVTSSAQGIIRLWDVDRDRASVSFRVPTRDRFVSALSPDGDRFVAADDSGTVYIHEARTGRLLERKPFGERGAVVSSALTGDAGRLATLDRAGTIAVWDVQTGRCLRRLSAPAGHFQLVVSPDGSWMAHHAHGGSVTLRDEAGDPPRVVSTDSTGDYLQVVLGPGGLCALRKMPFDCPRIWDPRSGRVRMADSPENRGDTFVEAFSPDGTILAAGGYGGTVTVWDVRSLDPLFPLYEAHAGTVSALAFSPDGRTLATGGVDHELRLWDVASHRELVRLRGHTAAVIRASFAEDRSALATCGFGADGRNEVIVWKAGPEPADDPHLSASPPND